MNFTEILISVVGGLVAVVGYLANRQLQRVDDKVSKVENEFFETKSQMLESSRVDKSAIIFHLENEIMPQLKSKKLDDLVSGLRADVTVLKEYQRNKISPTLERVLIMGDKMDDQSKRQHESDIILSKMFEVVKKLVEKRDQK